MPDQTERRFDLAEWVKRSRAAQGLPPKVTDPAALARVARLLVPSYRQPSRLQSGCNPEKQKG